MCRTQVRIHMNTPAEYFLKNPLGNHHIMLHGNYEDTLNEFFRQMLARGRNKGIYKKKKDL